jgi:hypothetical protein
LSISTLRHGRQVHLLFRDRRYQRRHQSRGDWIRTSDLLDPNQARYQTSLHPVAEQSSWRESNPQPHGPQPRSFPSSLQLVIEVGGFEPPAPCAQSRCASRLRHTSILRGKDLNLRSPGYEPGVLPLHHPTHALDGIRTRVSGLKGQHPRPLNDERVMYSCGERSHRRDDPGRSHQSPH